MKDGIRSELRIQFRVTKINLAYEEFKFSFSKIVPKKRYIPMLLLLNTSANLGEINRCHFMGISLVNYRVYLCST